MRELNLAFSIDEPYIQHFTVALISILENNKNLVFSIYVIHDLDDLLKLTEIKEFFIKEYDVCIHLKKIDNTIFREFPVSDQYPKSIYYRLLASDILPDTIDTLLYLDSDIVVTGELNGLLELDIENHFLYASEELLTTNVSRLNSYGVPIKKYFNSGVLLINLRLWRSTSVSTYLMDTAEAYKSKLVLPDQDVLNIYFAEKWALLPMTFNPTNLHAHYVPGSTPILIHFTGGSKPWHYLNDHPYKYLYWKYLNLSPFKDFEAKGYRYQMIFKKQIYWIKTSCYQLKTIFN